ncbi:MAG: hypothetical protein HQ488_00760 [Parcubacteria group bacterium]|nr:hypothetical protein [Parcubacteria group bacterium]
MSDLSVFLLNRLKEDDRPQTITMEATAGENDGVRIRLPNDDELIEVKARTATLDGRSGRLPWYILADTYLRMTGARVAMELARARSVQPPMPSTTRSWILQDGTTTDYKTPSTHEWFAADQKVDPPPKGAVLRITFSYPGYGK